MKKLLPLVLLILTAQAFGQKPPKGISVEYDKFNDKTTVETEIVAEWVSRSRAKWLNINIGYSFAGSDLKASIDKFTFSLLANCGSTYCFHNYDEVIFLIDGERWKKTDPIYPGGIGTDYIVFEMTRAELERLAAAKVVEFKVASIERRIRSKDLPKIKTLLDYSK